MAIFFNFFFFSPSVMRGHGHYRRNSELAELIRVAKVIIWDEAPMMHRHVFEAVDRSLRDICDRDRPFGGKVFVMGGDFRQCLPVVPKGTKTQVVEACLSRSPLWHEACACL